MKKIIIIIIRIELPCDGCKVSQLCSFVSQPIDLMEKLVFVEMVINIADPIVYCKIINVKSLKIFTHMNHIILNFENLIH